MKKLILLSAIVAAVAFTALAGTSLMLGTPATVNGTTIGSTNTIGSATIPQGNLAVSHLGLPSTNGLIMSEQISIDGTNWLTKKTHSFTTTNAATATFLCGNYAATPVYCRVLFVTTNAVSVSASYTQ